MPAFVTLINWTDQGIRTVKDSPKRLDAAKKELQKLGGEVKSFYMTQGAFDAVLIFEVPNDEAAAKFLLKTGSAGNVRTTTLKAYPEADYRKIMESLA
ncbi:MAG: GYD domain-containing protein [Nitrospirota bacterium]